MPVNIGPKIGIEGEDEYRKQIMDLVQSTKTLDAQMKALETTSDKEASAQEKAAKKAELLSKAQKEQKDRIEKLKDMVAKSTEKYGENSRQTNKWKEALANAEIQSNKLANGIKDLDGHLQTFSDAAVMAARSNLAEFFDKAGEAAKKLASSAYDAAKELDAGYDTIAKKTGATGEALGELQGIADEVFGSMPADMADVGAAVGELNTRFKLTGDELTDASRMFIKFAKITDTDVNTAVSSSAKVMKAFGTDVKNADKFLGYLAKQAQETGVGSRQLLSSLEQNGATLREMGLGLQESVKLLASFEENGVDASAAMTGLKKAIANGAKAGKSANDVIKEMVSGIKNAADDTAALAKATELFGTRGAAVMADGIRSGRISLDDLTESMEQYGTVVEDTFEATLSPWDEAKTAMNNAKIAGKELAGEALAAIAPLIEKVTEGIKSATEWFRNLPEPVKKVVGVIGLLSAGAAIVGPKILSVVNTIKSLQASASILKSFKGATDGAASSATGLSSGMGGLLKTTGLIAGVVGGAIVAVKAIEEAVKKWRLENDEAYRSSLKVIEAMEGISAEAQDYGKYLDRTRRELKAESEMEMTAADRVKSAAQKLQTTRERQAAAEKNYLVAKQQLIDFMGSEELASRALELGHYKLGASTDVLVDKYGDVLSVVGDNVNEYNAIVDAVKNYNETNEEGKALIDELTAALAEEGYTLEDVEDLADDYSDAIEEAGEATEDAFDAILTAAKEDLGKSITYLDEWADSGENSLDKMAKQMQKNAQDMANWRQNILTITSDARYGMDRNFTAAVDMLIAQGGKGATAVAQFADAMRTGNDKAVNAFLTGYNGISTQATQIENRIGNLQANATAKLNGMATDAGTAVSNMAANMSANTGKVETASKGIQQAIEKMKVDASKAKSWGAEAVDALTAGMESKKWQARKVATLLAEEISGAWHFSLPDYGPLRHVGEWGPEMVDKYVQGIESSLPKLSTASMEMAYAALPSVTMPSNTTNNSLTYGDIVVNVSGAGVQNEELLARKISNTIFRQVRAQKAVWA